uniref:uncharacterized protein n=1 Tax=Myxine glutinosa TaxID=7769 RepID=UPI00358FCD2A
MYYYSKLDSDKEEEYSPGNSGFQNDLVLAEFEVVSQEVYNELNTGWNKLNVSPFLEDNHHRSLSQNTTPVQIDDHTYECDTLNFYLDHLNSKLDFLEKEIQNLKTSAEPTFDLCWEEIDDLSFNIATETSTRNINEATLNFKNEVFNPLSLILCRSAFGSDYSFESSWILNGMHFWVHFRALSRSCSEAIPVLIWLYAWGHCPVGT